MNHDFGLVLTSTSQAFFIAYCSCGWYTKKPHGLSELSLLRQDWMSHRRDALQIEDDGPVR